MNAHEAITAAERLLSGEPAATGQKDPRWQAIIALEPFIVTDRDQLWMFIEKWGTSKDEDLRTAVATCLLEHLLEHHFEEMFSKVQAAVRSNPYFADTFTRCWQFGKSEKPLNSAQFDALMQEAMLERKTISSNAREGRLRGKPP
jgi:hypothetical protein